MLKQKTDTEECECSWRVGNWIQWINSVGLCVYFANFRDVSLGFEGRDNVLYSGVLLFFVQL